VRRIEAGGLGLIGTVLVQQTITVDIRPVLILF
jgi:hypothetical protein